MGGKSQPSNVTSTSVTEVPEEVKPYLTDFLKRGTEASRVPFSSYGEETDDRVSPLNQAHYTGMQLAGTRAAYGDPAVEAGRGMLAGALSGDYFNDPAFAHASRRGLENIQGTVGSMFGAQGLSNSGVQQQAMRDANDFQLGMINQERQRMPQYLSAALQYGQEPYNAAQQLLGVGDITRQYDQARINDARQQFDLRRQYPYQQLDVAKNVLMTGMGAGGTTTSTSPGYFQPSRTAQMLGGGALGYGLGSEMSDTYPNAGLYGAGIGAGLGYFSGGGYGG
tara:strand:+ start:4336 stop:5175 length:840 start_codon:yes stop_codon:yes gene_type:complete